MASPGIKPGYGFSIPACTDRVQCLISIMEGVFHLHYWLHNLIKKLRRKPANPNQIIFNLVFFKLKLALITHRLQLTAATLPVKGAFCVYTEGRRHKHLLQSSIPVILFCPCNANPGLIPDYRILYEKGISVYLPNPFSVSSHIRNFYC